MKQLIYYPDHDSTESLERLPIRLRETEGAASFHSIFPHSWVLIIQIVEDRGLNKLGHTITELGEIVGGQGLQSQGYQGGLLVLYLGVLLSFFGRLSHTGGNCGTLD
jgi:hypothetical protein